jgi:hypothetical protein
VKEFFSGPQYNELRKENSATMAEPYLERLTRITARISSISIGKISLEAKHFFSGAALFANGMICASLTPAGFAIKLPEEIRESLLIDRSGKSFRFFPNGPVKREYLLLSDSIVNNDDALPPLIQKSIRFVTGT